MGDQSRKTGVSGNAQAAAPRASSSGGIEEAPGGAGPERKRKRAVSIRPMTRKEVDLSIDWARAEGWNPGAGDAEAFWSADPDGFVAAEVDGEVVGTGVIVRYSPKYGFMGLFIVRPDRRGTGIGRELWYARRDRLRARLDPDACIGMDAVETMSDFYARGGFTVSHRQTRYHGRATHSWPTDQNLVALTELPFDTVSAFDREHFGAPRDDFLRRWIAPAGGRGLALLDDRGWIEAMGVIRPCVDGGFKIGPLFAATPVAADILFRGLATHAMGETVFLDTPRNNEAALEIALRYRMAEQFSCRRQYFGPPQALPWHRIFGVTTFELG
jgi:GNAT superfamily N-acetyltransferase